MSNRQEHACLSGKVIYVYQEKLFKSIRQGYSCLSDKGINVYQAEQQQSKGAKEDSGTLWLVGTLWLAGIFWVAGASLYVCCFERPQLEGTHTG